MKVSANTSQSRYEWAAEQLRHCLASGPSRVVSDIGTGDARMREVVVQAGGEWFGFDLNPIADGVTPWNIEQPADPKLSQPGAILMLDILEHLGNPWTAMNHVAKHLLPGGHVILTTPNPCWSRSRMSALAYGVPACFTQSDLDLNHHVFTPWPHIVEFLLKNCGLEVVRYDTLDGATPWPGSPYTWRYPARLALAAVNRHIEKRDPSACGMGYGVVARKVAST